MMNEFNRAMKRRGFQHSIITGTELYVVVRDEPADIDPDSDYHDAISAIPGVVCDEGQGDGYAFCVDMEQYTPESERLLLATIERCRR